MGTRRSLKGAVPPVHHTVTFVHWVGGAVKLNVNAWTKAGAAAKSKRNVGVNMVGTARASAHLWRARKCFMAGIRLQWTHVTEHVNYVLKAAR